MKTQKIAIFHAQDTDSHSILANVGIIVLHDENIEEIKKIAAIYKKLESSADLIESLDGLSSLVYLNLPASLISYYSFDEDDDSIPEDIIKAMKEEGFKVIDANFDIYKFNDSIVDTYMDSVRLSLDGGITFVSYIETSGTEIYTSQLDFQVFAKECDAVLNDIN